jgi:4-aminobutyrate aminotransferase-like enzyme
VGGVLRRGLEELASKHPCVAHVRGAGLFAGFDLVEPSHPNTLWTSQKCQTLFRALLRRGLVSMAYAPRVRINPPLIFSEREAHEAVGILDAGLTEVGA